MAEYATVVRTREAGCCGGPVMLGYQKSATATATRFAGSVEATTAIKAIKANITALDCFTFNFRLPDLARNGMVLSQSEDHLFSHRKK